MMVRNLRAGATWLLGARARGVVEVAQCVLLSARVGWRRARARRGAGVHGLRDGVRRTAAARRHHRHTRHHHPLRRRRVGRRHRHRHGGRPGPQRRRRRGRATAARAIGAPQWHRLPSVGQKVIASVDAPFGDTGPSPTRTRPASPSSTSALAGPLVRRRSDRPDPQPTRLRRGVLPLHDHRLRLGGRGRLRADGDLRLLVSPTSGAAPVNDRQASATPITALPYTGTADTSLADGDGDPYGFIDFEHCLLSAIDPSFGSTVWWSWTPRHRRGAGPVGRPRHPVAVHRPRPAGRDRPRHRRRRRPADAGGPRPVELRQPAGRRGRTDLPDRRRGLPRQLLRDLAAQRSPGHAARRARGRAGCPGRRDAVALEPWPRHDQLAGAHQRRHRGRHRLPGGARQARGRWLDQVASSRQPATTTLFTLKGLNPKAGLPGEGVGPSSSGAGTPVKVVLAG